MSDRAGLRRIKVVAALLTQGNSVLVQQRRPDEARALLWEFPGGKVEQGENERSALVRECKEELGIEVSVGDCVAQTIHQYEEIEVELRLFSCSVIKGEARALHANAVRFVPVGELGSLNFCAADIPFLEGLARGRIA